MEIKSRLSEIFLADGRQCCFAGPHIADVTKAALRHCGAVRAIGFDISPCQAEIFPDADLIRLPVVVGLPEA